MALAGGTHIPDGYAVLKIGGRPNKIERDIAVFLAKRWRTDRLHELVKQADDWIIGQWDKHGITDQAHVRAAVRRAQKAVSMQCTIVFQHDGVVTVAPEPYRPHGIGYVWEAGMTDAAPYAAPDIPPTILTEISLAAATAYPKL